jgi:hypothetical protein
MKSPNLKSIGLASSRTSKQMGHPDTYTANHFSHRFVCPHGAYATLNVTSIEKTGRGRRMLNLAPGGDSEARQ